MCPKWNAYLFTHEYYSIAELLKQIQVLTSTFWRNGSTLVLYYLWYYNTSYPYWATLYPVGFKMHKQTSKNTSMEQKEPAHLFVKYFNSTSQSGVYQAHSRWLTISSPRFLLVSGLYVKCFWREQFLWDFWFHH